MRFNSASIPFLLLCLSCAGSSSDGMVDTDSGSEEVDSSLIRCGEVGVLQFNLFLLEEELGADCSHYLGSIHISDTQVANLELLSNLVRIDGKLSFFRNSLRSLDGLESLRRIGGNLGFSESHAIEDIEGLAGLEAIGGDLWLNLPGVHLSELDSFVGQVQIGGSINIEGSPNR